MPNFRQLWTRIRSVETIANHANHDYSNVFLKNKNDIESLLNVGGKKISDSNILILGCGYNYPEVILWSSVAKQAIGIDVIEAFWKDGFGARYRDLRRDGRGITRSFANTIFDQLTYRRYFDELRKASQLKLDEHNQNLKTYDGRNLPFSDDTFDVVCSNAVLEHINLDDLAKLSSEISRITRPSGVSYHIWHNYYSLSGAHIPDEIAIAYPWGHLREDPQIISCLNYSGSYLNRMLPEEIIKFLSCGFQCIAVHPLDKKNNKSENVSEFTYEGEALLTKKLEKELTKYPRNTLLTRAFLFIGVKEGSGKDNYVITKD